MNTCKICGSHAINPHLHGRGGDDRDSLYEDKTADFYERQKTFQPGKQWPDPCRELAACVKQIREVCGFPDMPLAELPGMVEALLNELAARQIESDVCGQGVFEGSPQGVGVLSHYSQAVEDPEEEVVA